MIFWVFKQNNGHHLLSLNSEHANLGACMGKFNIHALFNYRPYRIGGHLNPKSDGNTRSMMNFKDPAHSRHCDAVNYFTQMATGFGKHVAGLDFQIAVIPSSKARKRSSGLMHIANQLAKIYGGEHKEILVRTKNIVSLHCGGNRSKNTHLQSIIVMKPQLDLEKPLFLLDDVSTTGNSAAACVELLAKAGATNVSVLILGVTTYG